MGSSEKKDAAVVFTETVGIMVRLRAPGGCPWDREQDFDSIKRYTLEEIYEVFDAIERRDWKDLKDELGDLLLQVLFYAQMAEEAGYFSIADVAEGLNQKLIRRHPHVFPSKDGGKVDAKDADTVLRNWEQIKKEEKKAKAAGATSLLDEVPRTMPAALEAQKLGSKAAKVGFDWPSVKPVFTKMEEEIEELFSQVCHGEQTDRVAEEFGDVMFTAINLARHLKLDPESALRAANAKFRRRFAAMEQAAGGAEALATMDDAALERLWASAKKSGVPQ